MDPQYPRASPALTDAWATRYDRQMSSPGLPRQSRQQRADIDSLYELIGGTGRKIDALDTQLDQRTATLEAKLDQVVARLSG